MAAECYGKLSELYPKHTDYRIYHAQALYNVTLIYFNFLTFLGIYVF
jgi:hypothetical protein